MKTSQLILVAAALLIVISCGTDKKEEQEKSLNKPPREEYITQIKNLEGEMHKAVEIDNNTANLAIKAYTDFVTYFPEDTLAPEYLFRAGEVAMAAKKYRRALEYYQTITQTYPNYKHVTESLYLQAFLLDNFINDDAAAKSVYEEVITRYPSANYAKDAKAAIENLGKTDEQLIEEFEKKNKDK